ncbi:MAG: tetratricopeptide repeat protein [Anaerolineales bacterium]|nr:tetratricopeptide repeat protein [Anaerolineales bacterium]
MSSSSSNGRGRPVIGRRKRPIRQADRAAAEGGASLRQARYTAPRLPPDALRRARLVDLLHEAIHRKLILISAAAGYGKTSLLAAFAAETDYPLAWLALSEADRDPAALLAHLVGALRARFGRWPSSVVRAATQAGSEPAAMARALAHEIDTHIEDYFVLVLDDFHLVDSEPAVVAFCDALLANLPEQAHLIIAGRTLPALRYFALVARQQIIGLNEEQLRFTADETRDLLHLRNQLDLPAGAAEALAANTEGWITGILLTTHLMWQGLVARLVEARQSERPLFDYLAAEVLDQQPPLVQQFLLESAVLPEMEAAVCNAVLGRSDCAELLRQAQARRLFISVVGAEQPAYQYHNLFRDFLQTRLRACDPQRLRAVQTAAARWYAAHDMPEAAMTFYLAARELSAAAELAEAQAKALFTSGRHITLRHWADQLAEVADQIPRVFLFLATAEADLDQTDRALADLAQATLGYQQRPTDAGRIGLVEVQLRRSFLHIKAGRFAEALALVEPLARPAMSWLPAASRASALRQLGLCQMELRQLEAAEAALTAARDALENTEHTYDLAMTYGDLSTLYQRFGSPSQAALAYQRSLALLRAEEAAAPLANALNNAGWDLYMLGQLESALGTYVEALEWARRAGAAATERMIWDGQANVLADLGEAAHAARLYQQALAQSAGEAERHLRVYVACGLARLARLAGNSAGALEWLRRADLQLGERRLLMPLTNRAGLKGILQVETGQADAGLAALRAACVEQSALKEFVDLAQTCFFLALAEFRRGARAAAEAALTEAFALTERIGYDQMLVREALPARDLLEALRQHPTLGARVEALLARAAAVPGLRARLASRGLLTPETPLAGEPGLAIKTLGVMQVLKDGAEVPRAAWGSQRPREMFFYLVDRMPVARDKVLAVFWPEMAQSRAVANLYQTLYRLRRALGLEVVVLEDGECRLSADLTLAVDALTFEATARQALSAGRGDPRRMELLARATGLYQGEYLPEVDAEWASERRRALHDLYLQVLSLYTDELLRFTRYSEARTMLARALVAEPLRDDLHGRMLMCLAAMGRRHEVVDHYRRYRELLRSELGLDPPSELRQLYGRLIE